MNGDVLTPRRLPPSAPGERGSVGQNVLGLLLGVAFTLGLFLCIAHYEKAAPESPPPDLDDLRIAVLPVQPPPLPSVETPTEASQEVTPMAGFEYSPSESAVKIAVSPPSLETLLPEDLSKAPPANASFSLRVTDFRPTMACFNDAQHIYQRSEVDRVPEVLDRSTPQVSRRVRDNAALLHCTLLIVVEANGIVGNARLMKSSGNPLFDDLMIDYIKAWVFSPGMKSGKKVRTIMSEEITVKWAAGGSPFQT